MTVYRYLHRKETKFLSLTGRASNCSGRHMERIMSSSKPRSRSDQVGHVRHPSSSAATIGHVQQASVWPLCTSTTPLATSCRPALSIRDGDRVGRHTRGGSAINGTRRGWSLLPSIKCETTTPTPDTLSRARHLFLPGVHGWSTAGREVFVYTAASFKLSTLLALT